VTAAELLVHLREAGITVELSAGRLKVSAPKGVMNDALRERIRANRDELVATLQAGVDDLALEPIARGGYLPLSRFQRRLWVMEQLSSAEEPAYVLSTLWPITEAVELEQLEAAIRDLVRRHEILRTIYPEINGEPAALILPEASIVVERLDLGPGDEESWGRQVEKLQAARGAMPFDLEREASFRWLILSCDAGFLVIVSSHHMGVDHWSFALLRQELGRSIAAITQGRRLVAAPLQYVDFADWQRRREIQAVITGQMDWWMQKLAHPPDLCLFPPDLAGSERQEWQTFGFEWEEPLARKVRQVAREYRVTPYMVLLAVCAVALRLHTHQTDLVIGCSTGSRERTELESMIGPFVNVLALRLDLDDDPSFATLLQRAREAVLDAHAHAEAPFESIVERLNPTRSFDHSPLFQVAVILHNAAEGDSVDIHGGGAGYDMTWFAREIDDRITMGIEYRSDFYSRDRVAGIASHFEAVLRAAALEPTSPVSRIPLAPHEKVLGLVSALQPPPVTTPRVPFPLAFELQARKTPSRTAVSHSGGAVSYGDLDATANRVARLLVAKGVKSGDRVGVHMDRTPLMLAALIGIQKLGAAYVPLDPGFPANRLSFMVDDCGARVVLTDTQSLEPSLGRSVLTLDETTLEDTDVSPMPCRAEPDDAAYVIYTSGSTGRPNGVIVPHRALSNFLYSMLREPGFLESDVVAAITTISFDIAALELFAPLLVGAHVSLVSRDAPRDAAALAKHLLDSKATMMQATPATWRLLLEADWQGSPDLKALCGGEQLPRDLAEAILQRVPELWNMYGPTETTIWSTAGRVRPGEPVHIGRPIDNTQVYVVNDHGALVPPGVAGEILIGGQGLALGYLDRPEISSARFVADRFSGVAGARLYRTGDLGMWIDGKIRHLGRLDHQVKIRGYRIELGEIETALMSHPAVRTAVVAAQGSGASTRLVAYCVLREGAGLTASEARSHLRSTLPDYMIPSLFETLDAIPMTPNGKVDRKSLPSLIDHRNIQRTEFVPCLPGLETELAEVWKEVLHLEQVGANDNFFEIGGHSLLSLRVAKAIVQKTGFRMEPRLLFTQSLRSIATALSRSRDLGEAGV